MSTSRVNSSVGVRKRRKTALRIRENNLKYWNQLLGTAEPEKKEGFEAKIALAKKEISTLERALK